MENDLSYKLVVMTRSTDLLTSGFTTDAVQWFQLNAGDDFGYPIDYWMAILGVQEKTGKADFLVKWEGPTHCHYHRHVADTISLVLEGEHHVLDATDPDAEYSVRPAGYFSNSPAGDTHMERGGPDGAVVLFSMQSVDGRLFEILNNDGRVINTVGIEDFAAGNLR